MDKIPLIFQANITQANPMENSGFTKCRARVFYAGLNRNGSYIDQDFAQTFIKTAIGCPVVGLWDYEKHDFTDHSPSDRKKAYGFIPEDPEFAWEKSLDYDGIEREYASFDIILWTKAFEEANDIIGHPLSMELNPDTINGSFSVINGEYCFYFTYAEMLGICVLGYNVEPCFEGASFITVEEVNEFKKLFQLDKQQALLSYNTIKDKGDTFMEEDKEMVPAEEFTVIRDDDIEEVAEEVTETEVTDNSALEEYSKNKEEDILDDSEQKAMLEEFKNTIASLEQTNQNFKNKIDELEAKVSELEQANYSLNEYKNNKIKEEKEKIISEYTNVLTKEELNEIKIEDFSLEDLNDKLAAMAYRKIANHKSADFQLINTNIIDDGDDDISKIVKKYKEEN